MGNWTPPPLLEDRLLADVPSAAARSRITAIRNKRHRRCALLAALRMYHFGDAPEWALVHAVSAQYPSGITESDKLMKAAALGKVFNVHDVLAQVAWELRTPNVAAQAQE